MDDGARDPFYDAFSEAVGHFSLVSVVDRGYVESFFERLEHADYKRKTSFWFDRPLGSMRTKDAVRVGAFGPREEPPVAIAYAKWRQRHMTDKERQNALQAYLEQFESDAQGIDAFMDQVHPRVPYARLGVVTPVAWYSGRYVAGNDLLIRRPLDARLEKKVDVYRLAQMIEADLARAPARRSEGIPTPFDSDGSDESTFFPRSPIRSE